MKNPSESELESMVDRELKKLPDLQAPASLVPQVLATLEGRARRPWWHQAWWHWPRAARWAAGAFALVALLACCGWPLLDGFLPPSWAGGATSLFQPGQEAWREVRPLGNAILVVGRSLTTTPWMAGLAIFAAGLYVFCIGVGAVLLRFLAQPDRAHLSYEN